MRNRIFSDDWNSEDFAVVGVPVGEDGTEMRQYLRRQELAGECKLDFTGHKMKHQDGRFYEDVKILSVHRTDPVEIAHHSMAYHPDIDLGAVGVPCTECKGRGCSDCGFTGMMGL